MRLNKIFNLLAFTILSIPLFQYGMQPLPAYLNIKVNNGTNVDYFIMHGETDFKKIERAPVSLFIKLKQIETIRGTTIVNDTITIGYASSLVPLLELAISRTETYGPTTVSLYDLPRSFSKPALSSKEIPYSNAAESVTIHLLGDELKRSNVQFGW